MASPPPPRAPTFPRFVDQVETVDTSDLVEHEDREGVNNSSKPSITAPSLPTDPMNVDSSSMGVPVEHLPIIQRKSVVRKILLWHEPKQTVFYFGLAMSFFYLTIVRGESVISVLGLLSVIYQFIGAIVVQANRHFGGKLDRYIGRPPEGTPLFRHDVAIRWASKLVDEGNEDQDFLRDVMYCDKILVGLCHMLLGGCMYFLGKYFSALHLLFVFTLALFSLPVAYERNKKGLDESLASASDKMKKHLKSGQRMMNEKTSVILERAPQTVRGFASRIGVTNKQKSS